MRRCPDRKILKVVVPHDRPRMLEAYFRPRHSCVAVRVDKIDLAGEEYVLVIGASGDGHEGDKYEDLEEREYAAAHSKHLNSEFQIPKSEIEWARQDSNLGPRDYESPALTAELQARVAGSEISAFQKCDQAPKRSGKVSAFVMSSVVETSHNFHWIAECRAQKGIPAGRNACPATF